MSPLRLLFLTAALSASAFAESPQTSADRTALLAGVSEITAPGVPGSLCAFGPDAFAVVSGKEGRNTESAVVAAGRFGKGRIVAFGHDGYLTAMSDSGTAKLMSNAVTWAIGGEAAKPKVLVRAPSALLDHLRTSGFDAVTSANSARLQDLKNVQALCLDARLLKPEDVEVVREWIRNGGGLVIAGTGWGWASLNPSKTLVTDFPGNQLLAPMGIVFGPGMPARTSADGYKTGGSNLPLLNASFALEAIAGHQEDKAPLDRPRLVQASATVSEALRSVPGNDTILRPKVTALQATAGTLPLPGPGKPLKSTDAIARLLLTQDLLRSQERRGDQVRAHPAAAEFPGAIPATAPVIKDQAVAIDTSIRDWHSTGLYAPAGAPVTVEIPNSATSAGLAVRIGCHSDKLWHLESWERAPEITQTEKLSKPVTVTANPFGGLIYVVVPRDCKAGTVKFSISGGIKAPRFVLGQTGLDEWRKAIRQAPGPWAELETNKIILTVPSSAVRNLDDPETLLRFWDSALDAIADLAAINRVRERPERIVADVQISAGYMHAGYPIMTHLDAAERAVTLDKLKVDGWGFWHELGHNHQVPDWTFSGTGEVTCNLFSLYVSETLCGFPAGRGHDAMEPKKALERLKKHLATRTVFERWKSDPFLALTMYDQLRNAFGWDVYKKVLAEYRAIPKGKQPKNDDEKRDQWLIRFSRAAGKNLGPFFEAWGVPTSVAARTSVATLPEWMPDDWPRM